MQKCKVLRKIKILFSNTILELKSSIQVIIIFFKILYTIYLVPLAKFDYPWSLWEIDGALVGWVESKIPIEIKI